MVPQSLESCLGFCFGFLPQDDDVLEQGAEHEDDASAHPNVQSRDVAHFGGALPGN